MPVSSVTSRSAVRSARSPGPIRPFGSAQVPSGFPAGRIAAMTGRPRKCLTTTPPAENSRRTWPPYSLARERARLELPLGRCEARAAWNGAPARPAPGDEENRGPGAPERRQRPEPEDLEQAPSTDQHEVAPPVALVADLLDQDRSRSLQLTGQEHDDER